MSRIDPTVKKETCYVLYGVLCFTAILQLVLLLLGNWELLGVRYSLITLLASLWTDAVMLLDFFLLGLRLQRLVKDCASDDPSIQMKLRASASSRFFLKLLLLGIGIWLVYWVLSPKQLPDLFALLLPVFFPRLTLGIRAVLLRKTGLPSSKE